MLGIISAEQTIVFARINVHQSLIQKIVSFHCRDLKRVDQWSGKYLFHIARTYLQPQYGTEVFGSVYLSAGQH